MTISVRCMKHSWTSWMRCDQKSFGFGTLLKSASLLPRPLGHRQRPSLRWTLGAGGRVCHASSCVQTSSSFTKANMEAVSPLAPPQTVRGMVQLERTAFEKKITVPHVTVKSNAISSALKPLKKYLLKLEKVKPVRTCDDDSEKKEILLSPTLVRSCDDIPKQLSEILGEKEVTFASREITVGYENWKVEDILRAVLPADQEGAQSYSIVGHILHLNLREHLQPYKALIGQVFLDKVPNISMVVNKLNTIDSTYRNFQMEVLGGSGETVVIVKENGCSYMLDFAKVYWNPRLSTEHGRVAGRLCQGDILYDVMAGVGPFAIPAGRKKCHVLANDLNPDSFNALVNNCARNKVKDRVKCFNMDGHDFIKTVLKSDLLERWKDSSFVGSAHITMNLPALAVTFLSSFRGLMYGVQELPEDLPKPLVHVYMFTKDTAEDIAIGQVAENLGYPTQPSPVSETLQVSQDGNELKKVCEKPKCNKSYETLKSHIQQVIHVRQVAPNKAMMRVTFELPVAVLMEEVQEESREEPVCKKLKSS